MSDIALNIEQLTRHFGGVAAVDHVSLQLRVGETLGVIGPNGAGKSTLVGLLSGALPVSHGLIELFGADVTHLPAEARTRLGIGRTHQIPRPFARLTVRQNLELAAWQVHGHTTLDQVHTHCQRILERTGLHEVAEQLAGSLPLLKRKRLELARALALKPKILLLDEIGAGLVEAEVQQLIGLIQDLKQEVQSILLIEHVMEVITACCERTAVLAQGALLMQGHTAEVLRDAQVAAVYLGTGNAARLARAPTPAAASTTPLLQVQELSVNYGGVHALRGVNLEVQQGQVVALLGANGAGKTTLVRAISGVVAAQQGRIVFKDVSLLGQRAERITALGLTHCLEGRRIFASLSVEENLLLATPAAQRAQATQQLQRMYELFPALAERRHQPGAAMSGGQQQMLAIARALIAQPALVIFDEISLGLAPVVIDQLYELLARVRASGVAILLVEQSIDRALQLADHAYVLAQGRVRLQGTPAQLQNTPELRALYVGEAE